MGFDLSFVAETWEDDGLYKFLSEGPCVRGYIWMEPLRPFESSGGVHARWASDDLTDKQTMKCAQWAGSGDGWLTLDEMRAVLPSMPPEDWCTKEVW